jgi:hypothetical protein
MEPMPTNRVTMRRIREALPLHLQAGLSYNEVGLALKVSKSVVGKYVSLARAAGVDWDVAQTLDDEALEARLYRPALPRSSHQLAPDFAVVHQELKRADVTLMSLMLSSANSGRSRRSALGPVNLSGPLQWQLLDIGLYRAADDYEARSGISPSSKSMINTAFVWSAVKKRRARSAV